MNDRLSPRTSALSILSFALLAWGIIYLAGCWALTSKPPPQPPDLFAKAAPISMEGVLSPGIIASMRAAALESPQGLGRVVRLLPKTPCQSSIPLPYIIPSDVGPFVGREWACLFVTTVSSAPAEPDWFAWIIVSTQPPAAGLPAELSPIGLPGCWLLIIPEQLVSVPPGFEALPGSMLTREPGRGRITLRWTPAAGMSGQRVWMQLLVHAPGRAPGNFLLSYAIEITVGS